MKIVIAQNDMFSAKLELTKNKTTLCRVQTRQKNADGSETPMSTWAGQIGRGFMAQLEEWVYGPGFGISALSWATMQAAAQLVNEEFFPEVMVTKEN